MSRRGLVVGGLGVAFLAGGVAAVLATRHHTTYAVIVAPPPVAPRAAAPKAEVMTPARSDEALSLVATASAAPVIAVASEHHVWISRDDGATFAPALDGPGSVTTLFADAGGQVYVQRMTLTESKVNGTTYVGARDELGVADGEAHERWHELADNLAPSAVRDGTVVAAGAGGIVVGRDGGASWNDVPGTSAWNPWLVSIAGGGDIRMLASRNGKDDAVEPGMTVLASHAGGTMKPVWSTPAPDAFGVPSDGAPCAAFVGATLYLVTVGAKRGTELVRVDAAGEAHATKLTDLVGGVPFGQGMKCELAGNEHAAYLTTDKVNFRIDGAAPVLFHAAGTEARMIAVDAAGNLLALGNRCLVRLRAGSTRVDEVVCGARSRE